MLEVLHAEVKNEKVIIPKEEFENFLEIVSAVSETLEILEDKEILEQIRKSEEEIEKNKVSRVESEEEIEKFLGLKNEV